MTVSKREAIVAGSTRCATAAFSRRAPSRWMPSSSSRAVETTSSSSSSGQTLPPALLCVSSSETTATRWSAPFALGAASSRICSAEMRPATPGSPRVMRPACAAAPPYSKTRTCELSSARSTSPGLPWSFSATWFAIVAVGRKTAAS